MGAWIKEKRVVNKPQRRTRMEVNKTGNTNEKIIFWHRINKKTQESWVKQAAMEIIRKEDNTMIKDIKSIQKEWSKILPGFQSGNETEIKRSWRKIERITWLSEKGLSNSLKHYPKDELSRREEYIEDTNKKKMP